MIVIFLKSVLLQALKQLFRVLILSKFHIFLYSSTLLWNSCQSSFRTSDVPFPKNVKKQLTMQCPSPGTLSILKKTSRICYKTFLWFGLLRYIMTSSSSSEEITTNCPSFILNTTKDLIFVSKVNCVFCRHVVQVWYHWKLKTIAA